MVRTRSLLQLTLVTFVVFQVRERGRNFTYLTGQVIFRQRVGGVQTTGAARRHRRLVQAACRRLVQPAHLQLAQPR